MGTIASRRRRPTSIDRTPALSHTPPRSASITRTCSRRQDTSNSCMSSNRPRPCTRAPLRQKGVTAQPCAGEFTGGVQRERAVTDTRSSASSLPVPAALENGASLDERFEACMVLGGVGDAIGYCNGEWEFCESGEQIHREVRRMGGINSIKVSHPQWIVSDDTVMHMATAKALVSSWHTHEDLYHNLASCYKECWARMEGRAPGITCGIAIQQLRLGRPGGLEIPFNPRGGGCGAAMRAAPIGLLYWRPEQLLDLVAVAVESGRLTHNHPTGYLGSLATALFVSYGIQGKPLWEWGKGLVDTLGHAITYLRTTGRDLSENRSHCNYFEDQWLKYLFDRGIHSRSSEPKFPKSYGVRERDKFYRSLSYSGRAGASGHDAPMIAYDALLSCGGSWAELCSRSMLHGGDSDSTGIIAAACWGAMRAYDGVPRCHYDHLEYRHQLGQLGRKLWHKSRGMLAFSPKSSTLQYNARGSHTRQHLT